MFNLDEIADNMDMVRKCPLMSMWGYMTGFASVLPFRARTGIFALGLVGRDDFSDIGKKETQLREKIFIQ